MGQQEAFNFYWGVKLIAYKRLVESDLAELQEVATLEHDYYKDLKLGSVYLFAQIVDPLLGEAGILFCAKDQETNRVVGYTAALRGRNKDVCLLGQLVNPAYRRQGIGLRMMKEMSEAAIKEGYVFGSATISASNFANITLYLNCLKWRVVGFVPDKFGQGEHRLFFRGKLDSVLSATLLDERSKIDSDDGRWKRFLSGKVNVDKNFLVPLNDDYNYSKIDFAHYEGTQVIRPEPESAELLLKFDSVSAPAVSVS